ncbi:c-type cytochrome [Roseateles saccharophilus]|uniref:Sulfur dehydrogenase subunit SoxD n=1 Tax=Roseateles saccharophilus TaxID=304 RepID=A0A4R3VKA6_ROSSA|nr:c-type cytochrome [Roseateles saccharophilus]MDG0832077.1 c-type cytochrome [Roseateles saccharophilus]TCV03485.1 sulfur dehydrogenase subunit SoxD [Roseateles saccharophilus]
MSSSPKAVKAAAALLALAALGMAAAQPPYPGIGRTATPAELKAWDIDVRPDFKGLPKGAGPVSQGQDVWEARCAACHGTFGESNEVFSPLVGGTTAEDIKTGRVARLNDRTFPGRTTLMKVSTVSTLWDYINRAMPWNAPKSLKTDEVYAVTAYLLNLGGIVPDDFTLSDANIADVQKRLPNRNGVTTAHAMWPGKGMGKAGDFDVKAKACMHDCEAEPKVASLLPDFARNNNGNLAAQQRLVGPQRGVDTTRPPGTPAAAPAQAAAAPPPSAAAATLALVKKHSCTACHGMEQKLVGPGFAQVAAKYGTGADAEAYLAAKIKSGGQGQWGAIPMPAQALPEADLKAIAAWLAAGAASR